MSTNSPTYLQIKVSNRGLELDTQRFSDRTIYIGRDPDLSVVLDNPGVSRRHAKIERSPDGFQIVDLQSGNGTFVNEQRVTQAALKTGDTVRISKFTLEMEIFDDYVFESKLVEPDEIEKTQAPPVNAEMGGGETVFLQPREQAKVLEQAKQAESASGHIRSVPDPARGGKPMSPVLVFMSGMAFGMVFHWLLF